MGTYAGFVDAYYLIAEGAKSIGKNPWDKDVDLNAQYVVDWLRGLSQTQLHGARFLRAYWYEGAYDKSDDRSKKQSVYHDAIAYTPGIRLRSGQLVKRRSRLEEPIRDALRATVGSLEIPEDQFFTEFDKHWTFSPDLQQKGVDTLITLDMVRLASRSVFDAAVLISGDADLAEVIRTVQDYGARVLIATPNRGSVGGEVKKVADGIIDLQKDIEEMITFPPRQRTDRW